MLTVVHDAESANDNDGRSLLDEIVRDGARQMLAAALQAEVAAYVERMFTREAPNRLWVADIVRREALFDRVEVRDHYVPAVAAAG